LCWIKDVDLLKAPLSGSEDSKEPSPAKPAGPPKPVTLKAFDPKTDKPLTQKGVTVEEGGWRVEYSRNHTDYPNDYSTDIPLFELSDLAAESGQVIYRAKVKTKAPDDSYFWGSLALGDRDPFNEPRSAFTFDKKKGFAEWTPLEARYPVQYFRQMVRPAVPVNLHVVDAGTVWIKDIEILHLPDPPGEKPLRKPGETVIKSFTYKDKTISTDFTEEYSDGRSFRNQTALSGRTFRLYELTDPDTEVRSKSGEKSRLIFRARMRSAELAGAYLQIRARYPNEDKEDITAKPPVIVEGNTNWATYEVEIFLRPDKPPDLLRLNLELLVSPQPSRKEQVWIKDMELLKAP
jgi:hypothetical protein